MPHSRITATAREELYLSMVRDDIWHRVHTQSPYQWVEHNADEILCREFLSESHDDVLKNIVRTLLHYCGKPEHLSLHNCLCTSYCTIVENPNICHCTIVFAHYIALDVLVRGRREVSMGNGEEAP